MVTSSLGTIVVRLGIFAVLARLLSPADFGVTAMAFAIIAIVAPIVDLDLRDALVQRIAIGPRHVLLAFLSCMISSALVCTLIMVIASAAQKFAGVEGLSVLLQAMCAILLLDGFGNIAQGLLLRARREKFVGRLELTGFALGFGPIAIAAALMGVGVWALAFGYIGMSVFRCALAWFEITRIQRDELFGVDREHRWLIVWKDLLRYTRAGVATRLLMRTTQNLDNILVGKFLSAEALGYYSRAFNMTSAPANQLIGMTIRTVVFPEFVRRHHTDADATRHAAVRATQLGAMILMPFCAILSVLSEEAVSILLGSQWDRAAPVLSILAIGLALRFAPRLSIAMCRAMGRLIPSVQMNLGTTLLICVLVPLGAINADIYGAAIALTSILIVQSYWSLSILARATGATISTFIAAQVRPAIIALCAALIGLGCQLICDILDLGAITTVALVGATLTIVALPFVSLFPRPLFPEWLRVRLGHFFTSLEARLPTPTHVILRFLSARYSS